MFVPNGREMGLPKEKALFFDQIRGRVDEIGYKILETVHDIGDLDVLIATLIDMDLIIKKD